MKDLIDMIGMKESLRLNMQYNGTSNQHVHAGYDQVVDGPRKKQELNNRSPTSQNSEERQTETMA